MSSRRTDSGPVPDPVPDPQGDMTLLFVYGLLRSSIRPPQTLRHAWADRMQGRLYDLGSYPAAIGVGQGPGEFEGEVQEIDTAELRHLDRFEGVDQGLYARRRARTVGGCEVWVYEYQRSVPPHARPLRRWPPGREPA